MPDPFAKRAENLHHVLLDMERDADEADLFAIGYMIPQIGLVLEMAEYQPSEVEAEDFDATYWRWLESTFAEDGMNDEDRARVQQLWEHARQRCAA